MAIATSGAVPIGGSELRTRTSLLLEAIALRHQIAVLEHRVRVVTVVLVALAINRLQRRLISLTRCLSCAVARAQ
jgi:hypothetical protein